MQLKATNIFSQNLIVKKDVTTTTVYGDASDNVTVITTETKTEPLSEAILGLPQEEKINIFNNTNYISSANAVKLLPFITNNNGKVRLYTEINSNLKVGDKVFLMYNPSGINESDGVILDNYLEFSGCTDPNNWMYLSQMQGYNIIEINDSNNEITIDRWYDSRLVNKKVYNHYIAKIYIKNIVLEGGEIDGAEILSGSFNNAVDSSLDINLMQAIILSGASFYMRFKNKYDNLYITTNSSNISTGTTSSYKPYIYNGINTSNQDPTPVSSYYTNNNNTYGYNYIYYNDLRECTIDNGYYNNCNISSCTINGGIFNNCYIYGSTINGGVFYNSPLDENCLWIYGTWSGGTFTQDVWYNGVWNGGNFTGKEWRDGIFNDGYFSGSTWRTGLFQGGIFIDSVWSGGTFGGSNSYMNISEWMSGTFNGGNMTQCSWYNGTFNGGTITNTKWTKGTFNGGTFNDGYWSSGIVNGGSILNSFWSGGTFNGGTFSSQNNVPLISNEILDLNSIDLTKYWNNGEFNGGTFSNSIWSGGTFNNGNIQDGSLWIDGTFKYGNFTNSSWVDGIFRNGTVTKSYFHNVVWYNGIWNSGTLGVKLNSVGPSVIWNRGTFNNGIFGSTGDFYPIVWLGGDFYNGYFYTEWDENDCVNANSAYGGFSGGTFHNGYFYGVFWKGIWVNGTFGGCNKTNIITSRDVVKTKRIITKRFGELPIINQQQRISNQ